MFSESAELGFPNIVTQAITKFIKYGSLGVENPVALNNFPIFSESVELKVIQSDSFSVYFSRGQKSE